MLILVLFISASVTIYGGVRGVISFVDDTFRWREQEYAKLRELRGGISIYRVNEVLDSQPVFVRESSDGTLTEASFKGHDYWVQAVYDDVGTVKLIAITACDANFKPRFDSPMGSVVLNESKFDVLREQPSFLRYFIGAHDFWFIGEYYGGNPSLYKNVLLGINESCPSLANHAVDLVSERHIYLDQELGPPIDPIDKRVAAGHRMAYDPDNRLLAEFRANSVINTYAETDILTGTAPILEEFVSALIII